MRGGARLAALQHVAATSRPGGPSPILHGRGSGIKEPQLSVASGGRWGSSWYFSFFFLPTKKKSKKFFPNAKKSRIFFSKTQRKAKLFFSKCKKKAIFFPKCTKEQKCFLKCLSHCCGSVYPGADEEDTGNSQPPVLVCVPEAWLSEGEGKSQYEQL